MSAAGPIGIFDSGLGGLSVAREIRTLLPAERLLYVADSAYVPYGGRAEGEIRERALAIAGFLVERGIKLLVVACNTASAAALEPLRERLSIPVVGMEPAVKPAAAATRNGRVGVMATAAMLAAGRFDRLMQSYATDVHVTEQACPGLVELVERGETHGDEARAVVGETVRPLREAGVDTVVLGCTHYPFLRDVIQASMGAGVAVIDTGAAVARQVRRLLDRGGALAPGGEGGLDFFTTGSPAEVGPIAARLWGEPLEARHAAA